MVVSRHDSDRKETRLVLLRGFETYSCHCLGTGAVGLLHVMTTSNAFPSPLYFRSALFMDSCQYLSNKTSTQQQSGSLSGEMTTLKYLVARAPNVAAPEDFVA